MLHSSLRRSRVAAAAGVAALLAIWAAASLLAGTYLVPAPWVSFADTFFLLGQHLAWIQILTTLVRVCVGFFVGFGAGLVVGIASGSRPGAGAFFRPIVQFFQGMPPLLWAIPLVALMGTGHLPTITVIGLITFPLVAVTVGEGMTTLPTSYGEMLAVFAPGFSPRVRELVLPHLRPFMAASVKAGLVLAVKASVTAEYFGAADGIGFQIQAAYMSLRIRSLFSWAIVLVLVILAFTHALPLAIRGASALRRLGARPATAGRTKRKPVSLETLPRQAKESRRILLRGIDFRWKTEPVLHGINLSVGPGRIAVVTGDSGVGKTTLLYVAAGILRAQSGFLSRPERLGFVFQDDRLLPWRTVEENVALPLIYGGRPRPAARALARQLLAEAGLAGSEAKNPAELSGGMKKRAALARCFARMPEAILMDEPFSGLHADARKALWAVVVRLLVIHPVPVILVTHYPREVQSTSACTVYRLVGKPARLVRAPGGRK